MDTVLDVKQASCANGRGETARVMEQYLNDYQQHVDARLRDIVIQITGPTAQMAAMVSTQHGSQQQPRSRHAERGQ